MKRFDMAQNDYDKSGNVADGESSPLPPGDNIKNMPLQAGDTSRHKDDDPIFEFFSGKMLASLPINHAETIEVLDRMDKHLDPKSELVAESGHVPLGYFLNTVGTGMQQMDSRVLQNYGNRLKEIVTHDLDPVRLALKSVREIFEKAEAGKQLRDPAERRKIAQSLRKVAPALDYVNEQLAELARNFEATQDNFLSEKKFQTHMQGERLSEHHAEEFTFLAQKAEGIKSAFRICSRPILDFRSRSKQIANRAKRLEGEFLVPPTSKMTLEKD